MFFLSIKKQVEIFIQVYMLNLELTHVCILEPNSVIILFVYVLAANGARPPSGTMLSARPDKFAVNNLHFQLLCNTS